MTKKLIEVPFRFTLSGTRLIVADDDISGYDLVFDQMVYCEDESVVADSGVFWNEDDHIILKDGLRCSTEIGPGTTSSLDPNDIEDLSPQDRDALGLPRLDEDDNDFSKGEGVSLTTPAAAQAEGQSAPKPASTPPTVPPRPNQPLDSRQVAGKTSAPSTPPRPTTPVAPSSHQPSNQFSKK